MPKVSVCIPTYNYGRFLTAAVESVLRQDFADYELLVIDDCSSDDTDRVMGALAARDPRIRYLRNDPNLGMVANWNRCLQEARGQYIKYLFADDLLWQENALGIMAAMLDSDPAISLVASARQIIDEQGNETDVWHCFSHDTRRHGGDMVTACLKASHNLIGEPTAVMFRRGDAGRGFDQRYRQIVDLEMWFHLLEQGDFAYIAAPLCAFRVHGLQQTAKNRQSATTDDDTVLLLGDYLDKSYVRIGYAGKAYLRYVSAYHFWKSYRKGVMDKQRSVAAIRDCYGLFSFWLGYPVFKIVRPIVRLYQAYFPPQR